MRRNFNTGLRLSLIIASLFGIKCYHFRGEKWKWINQIQSLYQYVILIAAVVYYPFILRRIFIINNYEHDSIYIHAKVIYASVYVFSRLIWYSLIMFTTIHTRLNSGNVISSMKKLLVLSSNFCADKKENYFVLFVSIWLTVCYVGTLISYITDVEFRDLLSFISSSFLIYGYIFPVVYCNLFFSVIGKLSSVSEKLKDETFWLSSSPLVLQMFKRKKNDIYVMKVFKRNLFKYFLIAEKFSEYFQIPVSLMFVNNIFYILANGTRMAVESDFHVKGIISLIINFSSLFIISIIADSLQQKVSINNIS